MSTDDEQKEEGRDLLNRRAREGLIESYKSAPLEQKAILGATKQWVPEELRALYRDMTDMELAGFAAGVTAESFERGKRYAEEEMGKSNKVFGSH